jgi:hypothetical protein
MPRYREISSAKMTSAQKEVHDEIVAGRRGRFGGPIVKEIEQAMAARGVTMVDCPISGGRAGARAGTLSVMVSGDPAAIEKVRPLISLWGSTLTIAGDKPGAAQVLKLTNNILFAVSLAATSEAFVMGAKGGLDPKVMVKAINAGSGHNGATQTQPLRFCSITPPRAVRWYGENQASRSADRLADPVLFNPSIGRHRPLMPR